MTSTDVAGASPMTIDHLVYAVPDLAEGVSAMRKRLGIQPVPGGSHPGWGTANALVSLGGSTYLEIIGPDPNAGQPDGARPFGIDALDRPRLATWAVRVTHIDARVEAALRAGYDAGDILDMSRTRPDGKRLAWRLTMRADRSMAGDGLVPFLIDWGATAHPTLALPAACELLELRLEHPDPESIQTMLTALDRKDDVSPRVSPRIAAVVATPNGEIVLA